MKKNKPELLLGAHVSISGGFDQAIHRAVELGCNTMQIFLKSNRQWAARPINQQEIEQFKKAQIESSVCIVVAHSTYLVNIGAPDNEINRKSVACLRLELERCGKLGIPYLVIHPGAYLQSSQEECIEIIIKNLNAILAHDHGTTMILLENTAGQGTTVGFTFEQLAYIMKQVTQPERIGICLDTCHAFVAGYDFRTTETYQVFMQHIDATVGIERLKVIHINDSKKGLGSRVDRHEHIGKGQIGLEVFRLIVNDPRLYKIPKILETPDEPEGADRQNMAIIQKLVKQ